jgi:peptidoglycan hydrolase-like amidase
VGFRPAARLVLATVLVSLAVFIPNSAGQALGATNALQLTPKADAWVNGAKPSANYGSSSLLRAKKGASESHLRFDIAAWRGLSVNSLALVLRGVQGDPSLLRAHRTSGAWNEGSLTYKTRPSAVQAAGAARVVSAGVRLDLKPLFPTGIINRDTLNLRITNAAATLVQFASRESTTRPRLVLATGTRLDAVGLRPIADAFANSAHPKRTYGSAARLKVTSSPRRQSYLTFDVSAWKGQAVERIELQVLLNNSGGRGISVYRVGSSWTESALTWRERPTGGTLLTTLSKAVPAGPLRIDVTAAFPGKVVNTNRLSLRILTRHSDGFSFSSREGSNPPVLRLTPGSGVSNPTPSPSPKPSPSPTPKPSASPSPKPSPSPTPKPSASPSPTPSTSPSPTPTPEPVFKITGGGNAHGAGMSQYGAYGRSKAGQDWKEILAHYYAGTTVGDIDPSQAVRVLLATAHTPSATVPARVEARKATTDAAGTWFSETFPNSLVEPFPAGSAAELKLVAGAWTAFVYDSTGAELARVPTSDLVMQPTDEATFFYMKFRDSLRKYDRYRGSLRMRVTTSGIQAVNIVSMDDYLKGVVPAEVSASWANTANGGRAAVRAQAVAARGYVLSKLKSSGTWDVKPDHSHQVYGGVNIEDWRATDAVLATSGKVVVRNSDGKPVETVFHAVSGGHTEASEYVWPSSTGVPGSKFSHLRARDDSKPGGGNYEKDAAPAASYSWSSGQVTLGVLSVIMAADSRTSVGLISSVTFDRGPGGRVYRATLVGSKGTKVVSGGIFKNIYNKNPVTGTIRSTLFYLTQAN